MQQFIGGAKCRRVVLDEQMDGRTDRVRCKVGEERYDICQGGPSRVKRNRNRESIGDIERELGRVRQIEERLEVGEQVEAGEQVGAEEQVEIERKREENRREAEKREAEQREAERRETEKREAERREAKRREVERMFKEEE